jgi:hypothetical protein
MTAMNEMLQWVRATLPMDLDWPRMIEDKIESLLEKEKQQIIDKQIELYNQLNTLGLLLPNSVGFDLEQLKNNL